MQKAYRKLVIPVRLAALATSCGSYILASIFAVARSPHRFPGQQQALPVAALHHFAQLHNLQRRFPRCRNRTAAPIAPASSSRNHLCGKAHVSSTIYRLAAAHNLPVQLTFIVCTTHQPRQCLNIATLRCPITFARAPRREHRRICSSRNARAVNHQPFSSTAHHHCLPHITAILVPITTTLLHSAPICLSPTTCRHIFQNCLPHALGRRERTTVAYALSRCSSCSCQTV